MADHEKNENPDMNAGSKKKKSGKKRFIIFGIEVAFLIALIYFLILYSKVNEGIGRIGSGVTAGVETAVNTESTGNGTVTGKTDSESVSSEAAGSVSSAQASTVTPDPNFDADSAAENSGVSTNQSLKGYTNIALVGIDTRDGQQLSYANSDTMIIASINNDTGNIRLVSVYRDTILNIGSSSQTDTSSVSEGDGGDDGAEIVTEEGGQTVAEASGGSADGEDAGETADTPNTSEAANASDAPSQQETGSASSGSSGSAETGSASSESGSAGQGSGQTIYAPTPGVNTNGNSTESASSAASTTSSAVDYYVDGLTTAQGHYNKANAAYAIGSAKQLLSMLNRNLDLNIHEYVVVDFSAVATMVEDLGGIDVWMTYQEVVHMNNYCVETSKVTGMDYEPIEPEEMPRNYHLNGVQAVAYARIRYTAGNDFKRTQRQRVVIEKVVDKAKAAGWSAVEAIINDVFPYCLTSLSNAEIIQMARGMFGYQIEKTTGFPFEHLEDDIHVGSRTLDAVVPVTLEDNVKELHAFLFDDPDYECSETVKQYSADIVALSGFGEEKRELAEKNSVIGQSGGEADVVR